MANYKVFNAGVGEEEQLSFCCERCGHSEVECSFDTYNRPVNSGSRKSGDCVSCAGTGFEPNAQGALMVCRECNGAATCPVCEGKWLREWSELPLGIQQEFLDDWQNADRYPKSYAALVKLYRNY